MFCIAKHVLHMTLNTKLSVYVGLFHMFRPKHVKKTEQEWCGSLCLEYKHFNGSVV